jgi:hypothetical protein
MNVVAYRYPARGGQALSAAADRGRKKRANTITVTESSKNGKSQLCGLAF